MRKHKFKIVLFIVVAVLLYVSYNSFSISSAIGSTVSINGHIFDTDIVENKEDTTRGLSGRASMNNDQAMLFIFPDKQERTFWMKEMNFDIDLLWIDDNKIVAYEKNMLAPDKEVALDDLLRYTSDGRVDKVLEINAGLIDSLGIKIGDRININI